MTRLTFPASQGGCIDLIGVGLVALLAYQIAFTQTAFAQPNESVCAAVADSVFALSIANDNGTEIGTATGFVVEPGLLLTNAHVANAGHIAVHVGPLLVACDVQRIDEINDLALCRMPARGTTKPLKLAPDDPKRGSTIYAVGKPQGPHATVSEGLFVGYRDLEGHRVVQMSAAISPGSSGGPIVNTSGNVVGVVVGSLAFGGNLNIAVPRDAVREFIAGAPDERHGIVATLIGALAAGFSIYFGGHK